MKTRYLVEWQSLAEATADAKRNGMSEGGALGDYIDLADYHHEKAFPTFGAAVKHAREVLPLDLWACPRIRRQILVPNDHDDLGRRVKPMPSYETEATWEVFKDEPNPDENNPDWTE